MKSIAKTGARIGKLWLNGWVSVGLIWLSAEGGVAQVAVPTPAPKKAGTSSQLDTLVVQDDALSSTDIAQHDLAQIVGGTGFVNTEDKQKQKLSTVADALRGQPGVLAQSVNGGEATRLSIRGSGIIRGGFLFGFGNQLELDGLRVYSASGNPYEEIEPLATSHIDVLRGANGFNDGPLSLGGVINYVTKTGYDASPFEARFEAGSFGYFHEQVSSGLVEGKADYYASITKFNTEGYRDDTEASSNRVLANVGYKVTDDISTRFNIRYAEQHQQDAGYLTHAQMEANPKQSQYGTQERDRINPGSWLVSNNTKVNLTPDSSAEFGIQYNNYPINGPGGPAQTRFLFADVSGVARYKRQDTIFGDHESNSQFSFLAYKQLFARFYSFALNGAESGNRPADQADWTGVASNDTRLVSNLWLSSGLAYSYQTRSTFIQSSTGTAAHPGIDRAYTNIDPRVGLRFDVTPDIQFFTNVSQSVDTPSANSFIRTDANQVPIDTINLQSATATTAEVGGRGKKGPFDWNVDYYYSWVSNELLTVPVTPGSAATITSNASPTQHQGVEAAVTTTLWQDSGWFTAPDAKKQRISLSQSYTWSHFQFEGDPVFGHNQLPGVPEHQYQAELLYEHPCGFYVGVNTDAVLTDYYVDFANTLHAYPYDAWGARIGYAQPKKGWEVFLQGTNLGDANYAPVVNTVYNANHADQPVYAPAPGRAFYGGLTYRF